MDRPDVLPFSAAPEGAKPGLPIAVTARLLAQELEVLPAQLVGDVPVDQVADVVEPGVIDYVHRLREVRELARKGAVLRRHRVPPTTIVAGSPPASCHGGDTLAGRIRPDDLIVRPTFQQPQGNKQRPPAYRTKCRGRRQPCNGLGELITTGRSFLTRDCGRHQLRR